MSKIQVEIDPDLETRLKSARWYNRLKAPTHMQKLKHHQNMFWIGVHLLHAAQDPQSSNKLVGDLEKDR